jgi:ribosomal protein S18 acetylase RimI-like enzyme
MPIWVRAATSDDAEALSTLAFAAKSHWGYPPDWMDLWRAELTIRPEYLREHTTFVAAEDGVPVGMCVFEKHGEGECSLEHVWIAPDRHGRGVGRTLVTLALREAATAHMTRMRVVSDPHAEGFYAHLGASRLGDVPSPMPGAPDRTLPVLCFVINSQRPTDNSQGTSLGGAA